MLIAKLVIIALTVALLGLGIWQEVRVVKLAVAERQYLHVVSALLILGSVDFLAIVFLSYLLGMVIPALDGLSTPRFVRLGLSGLVVGLTVAWVGQAGIEATQSFKERKYWRFTTYLALAMLGVAAGALVQISLLWGRG